MTAPQPIGTGSREVAEIDALTGTLANLRHWSATALARHDWHDDLGRRIYATAAHLRDEAWADCLRTAYALFEIDAIHDAWLAAEGRQP
jgi:hypothetical protein